jgi:hypothetical protein
MSRLAALEPFARVPPAAVVEPGDRCGLCAGVVDPGHAHVVDLQRRTLACTCRACHLLLAHPGAVGGRYRALPDRVLVDPSFTLSDAQWASLEIPVGLAFICRTGDAGGSPWMASYPGAAGAAQAVLPAGAWAEVAQAPLIRALAPEVEALLVYGRPGVAGREAFLVPIDRCYALVGLVRREWRGFSGGTALWRAVDGFFADVRARARPLPREEGAP